MSAPHDDRPDPPPFRVQPPPPPPGPAWLTDGVDSANPWTVLDSQVRYDNPWVRIAHHEVRDAHGAPGLYGVLELKNWCGAVVAVDEQGRLPLVGQWRFGAAYYSWEVPQGGVPLDERGRCEPLPGAQRELREETGYTARHWLELLRMDMSNNITTEHCVAYVAWDLSPGPTAPDDTERLHLHKVPFGAVLGLIRDGVIRDATTIAAVQCLRLKHVAGELPADLMAALAAGL